MALCLDSDEQMLVRPKYVHLWHSLSSHDGETERSFEISVGSEVRMIIPQTWLSWWSCYFGCYFSSNSFDGSFFSFYRMEHWYLMLCSSYQVIQWNSRKNFVTCLHFLLELWPRETRHVNISKSQRWNRIHAYIWDSIFLTCTFCLAY